MISGVTTERVKNCSKEKHQAITKVIEARGVELWVDYNKYTQGKIYKIVHEDVQDDDEGQNVAYIGSTIQSLNARMSGHKDHMKHHPLSGWAQYVEKHGGIEKFKIILIESYPCSSQDELVERERYYINSIDPICNVHLRNEKPEVIEERSRLQDERRRKKIASLTCPDCSMIFSSPRALARHLARKYPCNEKPYQCPDCHSTFKEKKNLKTHLKNDCPGPPTSERLRTLTQDLEESRIAMHAAGAHRQRVEQGVTQIYKRTDPDFIKIREKFRLAEVEENNRKMRLELERMRLHREGVSSEDTSNIASISPSDTDTDRQLMIKLRMLEVEKEIVTKRLEMKRMRLPQEGVSSASGASGSNG